MATAVGRISAILSVVAAGAGLVPRDAQAVPSFASQTGQPCTACHVGAFGPQLTPFGRAFKVEGYTQEGGDGTAAKIPLSAMILGSFNRTDADYPAAEKPTYFAPNNNFAVDQISVFIAGRITDWAGGFMQGTWSGLSQTLHLDQVDIRPFTKSWDIRGKDVRFGFTINNNPTVQDPYNSTFAWGFPYVFSGIAPQPAGLPLLVGGLANNTLGLTSYTWIDRSLYLEAGGYTTMNAYWLSHLGETNPPGASGGLAPYLRAAYEWNWNGQSAHVGGLYLSADLTPTPGGLGGQDKYTDYGIDGGYQFFGDSTHIVSLYGIYVHEDRQLNATNGGVAGARNNIDHVRLEASYWYLNTYGATLGWQNTTGSVAPGIFTPTTVAGSLKGKPDTTGWLIEAD